MAITAESRPKPKEDKISERQVIAQSFREARSVLDELERVQEFEVDILTQSDSEPDPCILKADKE